MTIIVLSSCPPKLRGDMTKWMTEINTGVYVGKLSAKVRDALWERICENIKTGKATMVFPSDGEQNIDFRVHNTTWEIADFDGIKLMRRPSPEAMEQRETQPLESGFSNAAKQRLISNVQRAVCRSVIPESFIVLDIETTGLDFVKDKIIEIAAIRMEENEKADEFSEVVLISEPLPEKITALTGITDEIIRKEGKPLDDVLRLLRDFIGDYPIVCHNAGFDINFLQETMRKQNIPRISNKIIDTLPAARKQLKKVTGYKLIDLARYYDIQVQQFHRALPDCQLTMEIFLRLNQC